MKKIIWISISLLVLLIAGLNLFWNRIFGYPTLDQAVQSNWKTPVKIVNVDQENELVLYLDETQYVFAAYEQNRERFHVDEDTESGWTASSDLGPAFLAVAEPKNNSGNFIWGALYSDISIAKFQIEYINGETLDVKAINNTFIVKMPLAFQNESELSLMETFNNIHAIDVNHKVIQSWKPES
ncbi:hypothetical protein [Paenibacillus illinoisensis]|uniref:hypothetical protein n=1 Tax=Paenibacillus illinoisensis TaxID=59845 RepID=UPI000FD8B85C|nr:hypothetical protein [Paenibacillus illinoisensis]